MSCSLFIRHLIVPLLLFVPGIAIHAEEQIPKHLELGRTLVTSLSPENTSYRYRGWVTWKGDSLTSVSEAHIDCSGFMNSLLERADCAVKQPSDHLLSQSPRLKAEDYFNLIAKEHGFRRIHTITDIRPGDIIAVKYNVGSSARRTSDTGHVMLVDAAPVPREQDTKPIIQNTRQWNVAVIDSSKGPHGKTDTRYEKNGSKRNGVGRGVLRLYASEDGKLLGYSWSTLKNSLYYDNTSRPLAIGRLICNPSPASHN